jgi:hypothetical protein
MKTLRISLLTLVTAVAVGGSALASPYWTAWVSDENGSPYSYCSAWNEAARGVGCSGSYCDNMHIYCDQLPGDITLNPSTDYWSSWFSEEWNGVYTWTSIGWYQSTQNNMHVCEATMPAGIVSGIRCANSYCDNVSLECDVPVHSNGTTAVFNRPTCYWSAQYSDENGNIDFGAGNWVTGAWCYGSYCDRLSYYVCSF